VIFVDSTIPMYLVGAPHPHKANAQRLLEKQITDRQRLVTDAEVLQEILRRYVAIDRREAIQPTFDALLGRVDQVLSVDGAVVQRAKQIVLEYRQLSARDAVHLSVMEQNGIDRILSFDSGFDGFPWYCAPIVTVSSPRFQTKSIAGEPSEARPALPAALSFAPTPTRSSESGRIGGRKKGPQLRRLRNWPGYKRGNLWIPDSGSHVVRELSGDLS
jgi:predicted nucleic acid-binding protein